MQKSKVAVLQLEPGEDLEGNLKKAALVLREAAEAGAKCAILPEMFPIAGYFENKLKVQEAENQGPIQHFLATEARNLGLWIVGGTIPLSTADKKRIRAACLVYNDQGLCVGRYDKIHLFDVQVADRQYQESALIEAGQELVVIPTPFGKLGLAVCYDLRFPELFRQLRNLGAELIALPSAFTPETGKAHWEVLCRARAIENQVYLLAAAQTGGVTERKTYGHSLIVDPWGEVLVEMQEQVGFSIAEIDLEKEQALRSRMPVHSHQRVFSTKPSSTA